MENGTSFAVATPIVALPGLQQLNLLSGELAGEEVPKGKEAHWHQTLVANNFNKMQTKSAPQFWVLCLFCVLSMSIFAWNGFEGFRLGRFIAECSAVCCGDMNGAARKNVPTGILSRPKTQTVGKGELRGNGKGNGIVPSHTQ